MTSGDLGVHYVSHKASVVRWRPSLKPGLQSSRVFAAGSWDDGPNNVLALYGVQEDSGVALIAETPHAGDVTDAAFVGVDVVATTSSNGDFTLFEHQRGRNDLVEKHRWNLSPGFPLSALAVKNEEAVVVGESGDLHVLRLNDTGNGKSSTGSPSKRHLRDTDSFTVNDVLFMRPQEILTANSSGQLKIWDLRQNSQRSGDLDAAPAPSKIMTLNGERIGVHALAQHPTQPHLVAAGGSDGVLAIWDLRQEATPATLLQAHAAVIWDVQFHPSHPDHLFTCSDDGKVLHWDASQSGDARSKGSSSGGGVFNATLGRAGPLTISGSTPSSVSHSSWTSGTSLSDKKSNIVTASLLPSYFDMPVNALDVESDILLCGTDAEAVFTVSNLNIH